MTRQAIVLFNLGGPDSPEAIRPFLKNFFMDKNIIRASLPVRMLVSTLIANRRTKKEAGTSYGLLGGKSPLLDNTKTQAEALEQSLRQAESETEWKVFVCMRYWHPMADDVVREVMAYNPDHVVLLPLYPQYSTTTTRSAFQDWDRACKESNFKVPAAAVCCYPTMNAFVRSSALAIANEYMKALKASPSQKPVVLFSAHGLPESVIKEGDPYQWQCEQSARLIADLTGIINLDWQICYQSRVGPKKWIRPSTEEALREAAAWQKPVIVYPHSFVSEHVETLVEIEIEYRHLAEELGIPYFARVPTVGAGVEFIKGLSRLAIENASLTGISQRRICPAMFKQCCLDDSSVPLRKAS